MSRDALVVGISTYQYLPSLGAPAHDAEAIAQRLHADGDFRITRLPEIVQAAQPRVGIKTPVTLAELETALVRLFKPKGHHIPHTALFYFSGHGLQKDAGIQEGYLATSDVNPGMGYYGISLFWLRRLLQESPVRQRIIILDCCHSGELFNSLEADPGARSGTDRLFMAASREYEAAYESLTGKYSIFTQALLEGLNPYRVPTRTISNYALTNWVSNALKGEIQQPLFENSGSEIILTQCQSAPTVIQTELVQEVCPYRGLEFFDEVHADYFFGREELTDDLIERLRISNFVAVVGASGSGKSSLIRAGLIYKLRQGQKFSGSDRWRIQLITPTEHPLKSLATIFVNPTAAAIERAEQLKRAEEFLQAGGIGLAQLVRASLMNANSQPYSRLVLIIDQFEEVFTLCQGPQAERDRHRFFNCLIDAQREAGECLSVVIVLRADFFGKCSLYNGLAEQIERQLVTVTPLTYEQIKASVVKPAQKVGLVCEPNLVYNILLDVVGAPGELPLLQYTLLELWQRRQPDPNGAPSRLTLDAYTELGGVRGTLQKRANEIFYGLNSVEQQVAKRVFIALTQLGDGTEDTRRRILKSELVSSRFSIELVDRVLEKLVKAKLVVTNRIAPTGRHQTQDDQELANVSMALRLGQLCRQKFLRQSKEVPTAQFQTPSGDNHRLVNSEITQLSDGKNYSYQESVDVAHETLIRNWSLLRTWLDENREMLRRQRRIEQAAREWHTLNQPRSPEYLLNGDRLTSAENYLRTYPDELSALAQRYVTISREESRRAQKELRLLQMAVPSTLLVALVVTFNQYQAVMKSQAEKEYQAQVASSRQRAAIAQSILQDPEGDPTLALMISRLAVEQGGRTYEAQASLRAALQKLRLQANLQTTEAAVEQIIFTPNQRQLITTSEDGAIRIWSLTTHTVEHVLYWQGEGEQQDRSANQLPITKVVLSPDGQSLAAIAKNAQQVKVWSVASGKLRYQLDGFKQAVEKLAFSTKGQWIIAASNDRTVQVWQANTGQFQSQHTFPQRIHHLEPNPDGQSILVAGGSLVQLWHLSTGRSLKSFHHPKPVTSAIFSRSGQWMATGSEDGTTRIWRVKTGLLHQVFASLSPLTQRSRNQSQPVMSPQDLRVLFSPDEYALAVLTTNQVRLWNLQTGQLQTQIHHTSLQAGNTIVFSPDSQRIVTTGFNPSHNPLAHSIYFWDSKTGQQVESFRGHGREITAMQFSPDGSLLATSSQDTSVRLWATDIGGEFPTLQTATEPPQWFTFRRSQLTTRMPSGTPSLIPRRTPITSNRVANQETPILDGTIVETSPGDVTPVNEVVTVAVNGTIQRWNLLKHEAVAGLQLLRADPSGLSVITQSPHIKAVHLLKQLGDSIGFWKPPQASSHSVATPAIRPPQRLESIVESKLSSVETAKTGKVRVFSEPPTHLVGKILSKTALTGVGFSLDSQFIAAADRSGSVDLWQIQPDETVKQLHHLEASTNRFGTSDTNSIHQLVFSPDNQELLGVSKDRVIHLWNVQSGKLLKRFQGHEATIEQVQFSPDGQRIVTASEDRTARIWQVSSGKLLTVLTHHDGVTSAYFSPDGQLVVTASRDGTARVMDATTGTLRVVLTGHRGPVLDAKFSSDGRMIVTAGEDGTARLWDAQTGTEQSLLRPLDMEETPRPVKQAFFSPDDRLVATLDEQGRLRLWAASWDGLLDLARQRSLRQLKPEECLRYLGLPPNICPSL